MTVANDFFSAYGVTAEEVSADPFTAPDNTYNVAVTSADITDFGKGDGNPEFFSIEFSISVGEHAGKKANMLFRMTPMTAADGEDYKTSNARTLSNYKKAMLDLGMAEEKIGMFNPRTMGSKLVGIKGTARIKPSNKPGYNNISGFQRVQAVTPVADTAPVNTGETEVDSSALEDLMKGF